MHDVTPDSRLRLAEGAKVHALFDEAIIHLPESSQAVTVNSSALAVLISCDGTTDLRTIAALIADELGAEAATLEDDVVTAARQMLCYGVLQPVEG